MYRQSNLIGEVSRLHSSLGKLIKFAKDEDIGSNINTNATNLTDKKGNELINLD